MTCPRARRRVSHATASSLSGEAGTTQAAALASATASVASAPQTTSAATPAEARRLSRKSARRTAACWRAKTAPSLSGVTGAGAARRLTRSTATAPSSRSRWATVCRAGATSTRPCLATSGTRLTAPSLSGASGRSAALAAMAATTQRSAASSPTLRMVARLATVPFARRRPATISRALPSRRTARSASGPSGWAATLPAPSSAIARARSRTRQLEAARRAAR
mmetsp:Transcript_5063/g.13514  ORF Transcript_5063/g.13514 Transcript_5063/m.13514 type:complete len:223 (-) Transcript_5063:2215-2883(-)